MKYAKTVLGTFINRPNRFIAQINIDGKEHTVHVKNTGRCKELLTPNAKVILEESDNPNRKTKYDLVAVYKGQRLVNMDSQAPNKAVFEFLSKGEFIKNPTLIKPECKYKNSRFDFYVETKSDKYFIEVKGVTLEKDGVVLFPDAPTERGVKHINELIEAKKEGFNALILFVIQMRDVKYFTPNSETHQEFANALISAQKQGVEVCAFDCKITENTMDIKNPVEVNLKFQL